MIRSVFPSKQKFENHNSIQYCKSKFDSDENSGWQGLHIITDPVKSSTEEVSSRTGLVGDWWLVAVRSWLAWILRYWSRPGCIMPHSRCPGSLFAQCQQSKASFLAQHGSKLSSQHNTNLEDNKNNENMEN